MMKPEDYIKLPYSRVLIPCEEGDYACEVLELQGCFSQGDNIKEAYNNINEAMESWIEASLDMGHEIPAPFVTDDKRSVTIRLEREAYLRLVKRAYEEKKNIIEFAYDAVFNYLY